MNPKIVPLLSAEQTYASHDRHPARISREYDQANKLVRSEVQRAHFKRLKEAVYEIVANGGHPYLLTDVAAKAIHVGLPVDPHALFAPAEVLAMEARYLALAIPTLSNLHLDARLYLADKTKRPADRIEGNVAWNMGVGGIAVNASGE